MVTLPNSQLDSDLVAEWRASGLHGDKTIPDILQESALARGDAWRLFHSDEHSSRVMSVKQSLALSRDWAARMQRIGIGVGDTVAIQMPNWWEASTLGLAAILAGARLLPLHHMCVGSDLDYVLRESAARILFVPDRLRGQDYLSRLEAIGSLPDLESVIVLGERAGPGARRWAEMLAEPQPKFVPPQLSADDVCALLFTSGTTSRPKGVLHTHNTLLAEARTVASYRAVDPANPTVLGATVFGHIGSVADLLRTPVSGANNIVLDRWEARACLDLITRHRPSCTNGTPFHLLALFDLVDKGAGDISSLKYFTMGATAISPSHVEDLERRGVKATRVYGSTEHPTVCAGNPSDPLEARATTDGRPLPGVQVRMIDDNGDDVPSGTPGELVTRGPDLFVRYLNAEHNSAAWLPGGWFRTGDIARMDSAGYVVIVDRKKDIIIRGGENLSSKEIEDALVLHCGVREAAVVAMPDPRYGERVCAFVSLRAGTDINLDAIRAQFAGAGLAKQKTPERIEIIEEFPRTASGKIRKSDLRALARAKSGAV